MVRQARQAVQDHPVNQVQVDLQVLQDHQDSPVLRVRQVLQDHLVHQGRLDLLAHPVHQEQVFLSLILPNMQF